MNLLNFFNESNVKNMLPILLEIQNIITNNRLVCH